MQNETFGERLWKTSLAVLCAGLLAGVACKGTPVQKNHPPVVSVAKVDPVVIGSTATLEAAASDPDGDPLSFSWTLVSAPSGSVVTLANATTSSLKFSPDVEGNFELSVEVSDGQTPASARATLVALPLPSLDGSLSVTVLDGATGLPLEAAMIKVASLTATTGADGVATLTDPSLKGPIVLNISSPQTVSVDHDLDAMTPKVDRPAYRGATLQGVNRPSLSVPLFPSDSARAAAPKATLKGQIDPSLFAALPAIEPFLSFSNADTTSSQIRAVLIAPLFKGVPAKLGVKDLLGRPVKKGAPLPGNLATDDPFLNASAPLLGIPTGGGPDPLTHFELDAPAGATRLYVLGILIDIDAVAVVPLLSGGSSVDSAALFGSMNFTTVFAATLDLTLTEGDNTLPAPLGRSDLSAFYPVEGAISFADSTGPWALDPTQDVPMQKASLTPTTLAKVSAPAMLADPRLAANLPAMTRVEITNTDGSSKTPKSYTDLAVPAETGDPVTELPYAMVITLAVGPDGSLPLGLAFTHVDQIMRNEAQVGLPSFSGAFAAAPIYEVTLTTRGMWPSAVDDAYELLPGRHISVHSLTAGEVVDPPAPTAFPTLAAQAVNDEGLRVRVHVERPDRSTTVVTRARATLAFLEEPSATTLAGTTLSLEFASSFGALVHHSLGLRTWTQVPDGKGGLTWAPIDDTLWDLYASAATADPAAAVSIALPQSGPFSSGDELLVIGSEERFESPLDLDRWSGERLRAGPTERTSDGFLMFWP